MPNQRTIRRTFEPQLQVPGGGELILYVSSAEQAANGAVTAQLIASNGEALHAAQIAPFAGEQREVFEKKVQAKHPATDVAALDNALVGLAGQLPRLIRESPSDSSADDPDTADDGSAKKSSQATQLSRWSMPPTSSCSTQPKASRSPLCR
jgi:hypothetical protein